MKKAGLLVLFLLPAFITQAELVDDFESYDLGDINAVTTIWVGGSDSGTYPSTCTIALDPVDSANKVIQFTEGGSTSQRWVRSTLTPTASINVDETSTMYFRVKTTTAIDSSFGLTDVDTPSTSWGDFRLQFVIHNAWQIREGGDVRSLAYASTGTAVPWNTDWYNVWLVITNNTTTPVIKVYMNQTDTDATEADRCVRADLLTQDTFGFRVNAADGLDTIFWRAQNNPSDRMIQIDNLHITSGIDLSIPAGLKPYSPDVEQTQDGVDNVDVTFKWSAGADPNGAISGLAVNPDIVAQYVFMSNGSEADPNLLYRGATGDPGNTPASEFDLEDSVRNNLTYKWAVVEAIDGYEPLLNVGDPISDIDPNNIIGPTWSFDSLLTVPTLAEDGDISPADNRVFAGETAVFTVKVDSITQPTVDWYKASVDPDPNIPLGTGVSLVYDEPNDYWVSALTITNVDDDDQGEYFARIDNEADAPAFDSGKAILVTKKLLAQYDFDGDLTPALGSAADAPTGIALDTQGDPNSLLAVAGTIDYNEEGADGMPNGALVLDPNEYIDFGTAGYPRAAEFTSTGYGDGLDQGTVVYWIKPNTADTFQVILANFNPGFGVSTGFISGIQSDQNQDLYVRGNDGVTIADHFAARPDRPEYDLIDGNWHMIAACWGGGSATLYVDGQWVDSTDGGIPAAYDPWDFGVLLGASRQSARHLLSDMYSGAVDNLSIYNYRLDEDGVDIFAQEYLDNTGIYPCTNMSFLDTLELSQVNLDNTGNSYCKIDLADFALFVEAWLADGLYDAP